MQYNTSYWAVPTQSNLANASSVSVNAQIVADLIPVKAEPAAACLACRSPISFPSKSTGLSKMHVQKNLKKLPVSQLNCWQDTLVVTNRRYRNGGK